MDKACICRIRDIYKAIARFESEVEKTFSLNINELTLLCILAEKQCLSSGELTRELSLSASNTSKVIGALEAKGHVKRRLSKEDKRSMLFTLTPKGTAILSDVCCHRLQIPPEIAPLLDPVEGSRAE